MCGRRREPPRVSRAPTRVKRKREEELPYVAGWVRRKVVARTIAAPSSRTGIVQLFVCPVLLAVPFLHSYSDPRRRPPRSVGEGAKLCPEPSLANHRPRQLDTCCGTARRVHDAQR